MSGADQCGNRDEAHRAQEVGARHGLEHCQPSHRQQHRPANALHHARRHQLRQLLRGGAQQRAQREHDDRRQEGTPGAEAVRNPARCRDEHRHRQRITEDHRLHLQRAFVQAARHRRQCRIDDGRIQHLHEDRQRHQPQQRLDGVIGTQGRNGLRHGDHCRGDRALSPRRCAGTQKNVRIRGPGFKACPAISSSHHAGWTIASHRTSCRI